MRRAVVALVLVSGVAVATSPARAPAGAQAPEIDLVQAVVPATVRPEREVLLTARVVNPPQGFDHRTAYVFWYSAFLKESFGEAPLRADLTAQRRILPPQGWSDYEIQAGLGWGDDQFAFADSVTLTFVPGTPVQVGFTTVPSNPTAGDDVLVRVTVSSGNAGGATEGGAPVPSGVVTVSSGNTAIGSGSLNGAGRSDIPVTLPSGTAPITVAYEGDDLYFGSASDPVTPSPADPGGGGQPPPPVEPPPGGVEPDGVAAGPAADPADVPDEPEEAAADEVDDQPEDVPDEPLAGDEVAERADDGEVAAGGGDGRGGDGEAERSGFVRGIPTPRDVDWGLGHVSVNLFLTLLLMLLVAIPAELVDSTLEGNYERIVGAHPRARRWAAGVGAWLERLPDGLLLGGLSIAAAVVFGQLEYALAWDLTSVVLLTALAAVVAVTIGVHDLVRLPYLNRRSGGRAGGLGLYPFGFGLAILLVVVSKVAGFEPGFVFGVVGGLALSEAVSERDEGRSLAASGGALLLIAFVAWWVWTPFADRAVEPDPGLVVLFADAFLATLWMTCVQAVAFGFAPLRFLDGQLVRAWNPWAWLGLQLSALFLLVQFYLHPSAGRWGVVDTNTMGSALSVFGVFLLAAVLFWAWFRFRAAPDPAPSEDELPVA